LDLPATPGPNHPGGKIAIGKDHYLYTVIGDLNNEGQLQNIEDGPEPNDSSVILKISPKDGSSAKDNPFLKSNNNTEQGESQMDKYYGYGIRNSFGLAIDPLTGFLWEAENGDRDYDEVNIVRPGFNSGWSKLMGPISESDVTEQGVQYQNVGDITSGNIYFFEVNQTRTGLTFDNAEIQEDLIADDEEQLESITLGRGFGGITDLETGPDGLLYVLTFDQESDGDGKIYRILPSGDLND